MTKLDSAIYRIAFRVERLQRFVNDCPDAAHVTKAEKSAELRYYRHALSILIAHRATTEKDTA